MSLNPSDIESHHFRDAFRGYDKDDVDEFLDRVSDRINELLLERQRLEDRIATIEADAAESVEAERLLKRTLITAQRTADETVAEAREEAERIRAEADRHAAEVREDAEQRAAAALHDASDQAAARIADAEERASATLAEAGERATSMLTDAERDAARDRELARAELERVRAAVADLERFRGDYRERIRVLVAEQLAALDRVGEMPEVPAEVMSLPDDAAADLQALSDDAPAMGDRIEEVRDGMAPRPDEERPEGDGSDNDGRDDSGGDATDTAADGIADEGLGTMPDTVATSSGEGADDPDATRLFTEEHDEDPGHAVGASRPVIGRRARRRGRNEERA